MENEDYDIVVSGGGLAGLSACAVFAHSGFAVCCVDPALSLDTDNHIKDDTRTTAILHPGQKLLEDAEVWKRMAPHAAPLNTMRIVDISGPTSLMRDFNSTDVSEHPFGWNVPNRVLRQELIAHLSELANVDLRTNVAVSHIQTRETEARIKLSNGSRLRTRLVVAADGRDSVLRTQAGISVQTTRFGQKALAFAVTHEIPHNNISTEIHLSGGPFTLVPLPDLEAQPCSAVVWMDDGTETMRRYALDPAAFETEMTARSGNILGPLKLVNTRTVWPIIAQIAQRFSAERLALVAEAAHVVPPIGAQGLNMSLKDIQVLHNLMATKPEDIGDADMLQRYHRMRWPDVQARVTGVTMLNKTSQLNLPLTQRIRAAGIGMLHDIAPLRKTAMKLGLGAQD